MPNYPSLDLRGKYPKDTFQNLVQNSSSIVVDGYGDSIDTLNVTASVAVSAVSASYAINGGGTPATYTSSLYGTASWATAAVTANAISFVPVAATSASWVSASAFVTTAQTASYVSGSNVRGVVLSSSYSPVEPAYSASVSAVKQNTLVTGNTYTITASWATNVVNGSTATYTSSLYGTASWANNAISASYALSGGSGGTTLATGSTYPITASWATSATSASYAPGSPSVSASYAITASYVANLPSGSTLSASYSLTASYALNADNTIGTYVDSIDGNDTGSGTFASPYKTIAKINSLNLPSHSTIYVKRGSEFRESLMIDNDYTSVIAYGDWESNPPLFDCSDIISASQWTKTSGSTNVYQCNILTENNIPSAPDFATSVWENDNRYRLNHSTTSVDATGSTYYPTTTDNFTWTVYIHPSGSTDPRVDYNKYEVSTRMYGVSGQNKEHIYLDGLRARRNINANGSIIVGKFGIVKNCIAEEGNKHNLFYDVGTELTNCKCKGAYFDDQGSTMFIGFGVADANNGCTLINCVCENYGLQDPQRPGFYNHTTVEGTYWKYMRYYDCTGSISSNGDENTIDGCKIYGGTGIYGATSSIKNSTIEYGDYSELSAITSLTANSLIVIDNVDITKTISATADAMIDIRGGNKTVIVTDSTFRGAASTITMNLSGNYLESFRNYFSQSHYVYYVISGSIVSDYNIFNGNVGNEFAKPNNVDQTYAQWTASGQDLHSTTAKYIFPSTGLSASWASSSLSASYSLTASYALNGGSATYTSSLYGTASWANNVISASYAPGNPSISASYAVTASYVENMPSGSTISSSYALTASYVDISGSSISASAIESTLGMYVAGNIRFSRVSNNTWGIGTVAAPSTFQGDGSNVTINSSTAALAFGSTTPSNIRLAYKTANTSSAALHLQQVDSSGSANLVVTGSVYANSFTASGYSYTGATTGSAASSSFTLGGYMQIDVGGVLKWLPYYA